MARAESHGGRPIVLDMESTVIWYMGLPNGSSKEDKWVAKPIYGHREHECRK